MLTKDLLSYQTSISYQSQYSIDTDKLHDTQVFSFNNQLPSQHEIDTRYIYLTNIWKFNPCRTHWPISRSLIHQGNEILIQYDAILFYLTVLAHKGLTELARVFQATDPEWPLLLKY